MEQTYTRSAISGSQPGPSVSDFVKYLVLVLMSLTIPVVVGAATDSTAPVSDATQDCIDCHISTHPGIVADWKRSRHSKVTPDQAMGKKKLERRVSADKVPDNLKGVAVGCAECHGMNPRKHKDTFNHNDYDVHVMVSPNDCATCHPDESRQFSDNIMSWAHVNLADNKLYHKLVKSINGMQRYPDMKVAEPDKLTDQDSCYQCHGTKIEVTGKEKRDTDQGEMEFPKLSGWPNQGVGRINTDGSQGSCSACHSRHQFSIKMARKPYTCSQCHKGPDVPAYAAFSVSKHGNLHSALNAEWDFNPVPWTLGKDFSAPTCAACHVSLLVTEEGDVVAERSHRMNDRLPWRILGLIYAHPHPKSPNTSIIRNKDGLPLPTTFSNERAESFLIDQKEMVVRKERLQKVCLACHSLDWVNGHWARFENTIKATDEMTLSATHLMIDAWKKGAASQQPNPFDEGLEKLWVEQYLFFANSTRYASAMMGADYGVFANGRWYLSKNLRDMVDKMKFLLNPGTGESHPSKGSSKP